MCMTYRSPSKHQRSMSAGIICAISIVYLLGYIVVQRAVGGQPAATMASIRALPPVSSPGLVYAPDYNLPSAQSGQTPTIYRVQTQQPVVFLTIDDGVYREAEAAVWLRNYNVPASLFLAHGYVASTPAYFKDMAQYSGSVVENHTMHHADLTTLDYEGQKREICETADAFSREYGHRPSLLRPPYGNYNVDTQRAAADCGMRAIVLWHALVDNGSLQYQVGEQLQPGDIVLMHFTSNFKQDVQAFAEAASRAGLYPQLLEDWLAN